ncbi:hypothetical protein HDR66_03550 [bacterium]|nr:hypothetical protein [bacterium]
MSRDVFKSLQARELIAYVANQYGRDLEFLWPRFPDNAIWRRGDNQKWFGAILTVKKNKIVPGADDAPVEILDVRCAPDAIDFVVDNKMIFPGWHMNKRHWITVILDGRMDIEKIYSLVDASYISAAKK